MPYEHLRVSRETPTTARHPRRGFGGPVPADVRAHATLLARSLEGARERIAADLGGFDDRRLLKIRLHPGDKTVPPFGDIPGVEVVSQEAEAVILAFATEGGLAEFESRIATLARDGAVTRKELLYAIEAFDSWTSRDRMGHALREQGYPPRETFLLDVELWPQERQDKRDALMAAFLQWLAESGIERLDEIRQPSLLMARVRCTREAAEQLLQYRDVRTVDLPPRLGVSVELLLTDVNVVPPSGPLGDDAPRLAVLDSGLTSGHPLLAPAVGDAQGYLSPRQSHDEHPWHGTFVSGIALYGDIEHCVRVGAFVPRLRLFSGRVFRDDHADETVFVERAVEEAVRNLHREYGCRIFNLSYGDLNKVYDGRHLRGLAYILDMLARDVGVLFVVPTGNLLASQLPSEARRGYPEYLLTDAARLLDPATALNAITVGGLARHEATRDAQRYDGTLEDHPIARTDQPFPLTRRGPSIVGAVKPDVVEHAGNLAEMRTGGRTRTAGLGVVSLNGGFAGGTAFREDVGTSYAAPLVAHKAARVLSEIPTATPLLLRAILGVHAKWPAASEALLNPNGDTLGRDKLLHLIGYGRIDESALFRSLDDTVTLLAEETLATDQHHFFELPLPDTFWSRGRRSRQIGVGLAYAPAVRTTRLEYRETKLSFQLVTAASLDEVTRAFRRNREQGMGERSNGRSIPNEVRKCGTLQTSRWTFRQPIARAEKVFIVVTRQDASWSTTRDSDEPYALAVVLADREQANSTLYADVRVMLQARAQARARART